MSESALGRKVGFLLVPLVIFLANMKYCLVKVAERGIVVGKINSKFTSGVMTMKIFSIVNIVVELRQ